MKKSSPIDSTFNVLPYHEVFSSALANLITYFVSSETSKDPTVKKEVKELIIFLYAWARAYNNAPITEKERIELEYLEQIQLIGLLVPEMKKAGLTPVQASFGESYYSRVISKIKDIEDLHLFLILKDKKPEIFLEIRKLAEKLSEDL